MPANDFLAPVLAHVNHIFTSCRIPNSPMLADGFFLDTGAHCTWEGQTTANLACQQNFLRVLDALGTITGDAQYQNAAQRWIAPTLEKLQHPASSLLYWGGHTSYDPVADKPILGNHEMKCVYPHYPGLYRAAPDITRRFVEAAWHAHIDNWPTLLFNRHGDYEPWTSKWESAFAGGPLPLIENRSLSFINTGSDLVLAALSLYALGGDEQPKQWAMHLLSRYEQIRHPTTGLAGYQFNHRAPCRVRASFKPPLSHRDDLNEVSVLTDNVIRVRYGRTALTLLNLAAMLPTSVAAPLTDLVRRDLTALAEHCYDEATHRFYPAINDATRLAPEDTVEGAGYCGPAKLGPVYGEGLMFLVYARAARLTGEDRFGQMAVSLAEGLGLPGLRLPPDYDLAAIRPDPSGWVNPSQSGALALAGLVELHGAGDQRALRAAVELAQRLLQRDRVGAVITSGTADGRTNIDSALPLALLHLAAALDSGPTDLLPPLQANNTYFDPKIVIHRRRPLPAN